MDADVTVPAAVRHNINLATSIDTSPAKQWLRDAVKTKVKKSNLRTTEKIVELVADLDRRIAAGERPFGRYLDRTETAPPGALYDFEQVWKNRLTCSDTNCKLIERFGCQLNWLTQKKEPGYWHANKDTIPFAQEFAVLSHIHEPWVQKLNGCGLFTKLFHGNWVNACWDHGWCRKCNWNRRIAPKQRSYPVATWVRAGHCYGYTISYETESDRARAIGRLSSAEDYDFTNPESIIYGAAFRAPNWNLWGPPHLDRAPPQFIEQFRPDVHDNVRRLAVQYASRKFLGACQHAIGGLVKSHLLDGAEQICEVALGFMPFRFRWHVHGLACSSVTDDPQAIAGQLKQDIDARLAQVTDRRRTRREAWPVNQRLYANVKAVKFTEHQQLLNWIKYIYKTVNYWEPIREVYLRTENLLPDGSLHPDVHRLLVQEVQAMRQWIDETFDCKGLTLSDKDGTRRLNRSFVWGCLKFGNGQEFIRRESAKERQRRYERAEKQRQRRAKKKEKKERQARQAEE